eukprot:12056699-Heterocapsa_arctica.AAC.1
MKTGSDSPGNPAHLIRQLNVKLHLPTSQALPGGRCFSSLLRAWLPPGETTPTQGFAKLTGFS